MELDDAHAVTTHARAVSIFLLIAYPSLSQATIIVTDEEDEVQLEALLADLTAKRH